MEEKLSFFQKCSNRIDKVNSLLCIEIDPQPPSITKYSHNDVYNFCVKLIADTVDFVCSYKFNISFFEGLGPSGLLILKDVIQFIPTDIPVIIDAKRGDFSSACEKYALSAFNILRGDAITTVPYLGLEHLKPFIDQPSKGMFVVCKTNSSIIQDLSTPTGYKIYEIVSLSTISLSEYDNVGLLINMTEIDAIIRVRNICPNTWLFVSDNRENKDKLAEIIQFGMRSDNSGIIIGISDDISQTDNPRVKALHYRDLINSVRNSSTIKHKIISPDLSFDKTKLFNSSELVKLVNDIGKILYSFDFQFDAICSVNSRGYSLLTAIAVMYLYVYGRELLLFCRRGNELSDCDKLTNKHVFVIVDTLQKVSEIHRTIRLINIDGGEIVGILIINNEETVAEKLRTMYSIPVLSLFDMAV